MIRTFTSLILIMATFAIGYFFGSTHGVSTLTPFSSKGVVLLSGQERSTGFEKKGEIVRTSKDSLFVGSGAIKNITTVVVQKEEYPDRLQLMGRISVPEDHLSVVPARVGGRIESVSVASGEPVMKGQILCTIFSPDFVAAREEYLSTLKKASSRGSLNEAVSEAEGKPMGEDEFVSLSKMSRKRLINMGLKNEDIDALASDRQPNLVVRAPRDGVIIVKNATVGNLANFGENLFTIADIKQVWFTGDVYPENLSKIHKDQEIQIVFQDRKEPLRGVVSFISPVIDVNSRTIKIRALIDNSENQLKADMVVPSSIILEKRFAITVPIEATIRLDKETVLFLKTGERSFKKVAVELRKEQEGRIEIVSGINSGDEIATKGVLLLSAALNYAEIDPSHELSAPTLGKVQDRVTITEPLPHIENPQPRSLEISKDQ